MKRKKEKQNKMMWKWNRTTQVWETHRKKIQEKINTIIAF